MATHSPLAVPIPTASAAPRTSFAIGHWVARVLTGAALIGDAILVGLIPGGRLAALDVHTLLIAAGSVAALGIAAIVAGIATRSAGRVLLVAIGWAVLLLPALLGYFAPGWVAHVKV